MKEQFKGKNILVTGGTGSIGSEIVRQLLKYEPKVVRIFDQDEAAQFELQEELRNHPNTRPLLGNVRDKNRLKRAMEDIDIVFHAAALKHIHLCEYNPMEAIQTNVIGTKNVIEAALESPSVEKVINISTDKAANPGSTMGASKLLTERIVTWASFYRSVKKPVFASVRFGNVLDSRGSVIPFFKGQIERGGPVTVTDLEMKRFMMHIEQAVKLVLKAAEEAKGGEIFVLKMPVVKLGNLVELLIEKFSPNKKVEIEIIGKRAGERLNEQLMSSEEAEHALETDNMFIILPTWQLPHLDIDGREYSTAVPLKNGEYDTSTAKRLNKTELKEFLKEETNE